jgi:hypothetical protein
LGTKRRTADQLLLSGSLRKNPKRHAARFQPQVAQVAPAQPLGEPAPITPKSVKLAWAEIAGPRPWLTVLDRPRVETVAKLLAAQRKQDEVSGTDAARLLRELDKLDKLV